MKHLQLFLFFCAFAIYCKAQGSQRPSADAISQYWLVMIKTGPKNKEITDTAERNKIFAGHFANINKLYNDGILKVAGPFGDNDFHWEGLFVLDCATKAEAQKYISADPSISSGVFIVDIVPWYSLPVGSFVHGKPKQNESTKNN